MCIHKTTERAINVRRKKNVPMLGLTAYYRVTEKEETNSIPIMRTFGIEISNL